MPGNDRSEFGRYKGKQMWNDIMQVTDLVACLYASRVHNDFNSKVTKDASKRAKAGFDVLLSGAARYLKIHHDIIEHHGIYIFKIQLLRNSNLHFFAGMNSALMLETLKCVGPSLR